jgi:membrane-bound lytic murein transglycosylase B
MPKNQELPYNPSLSLNHSSGNIFLIVENFYASKDYNKCKLRQGII